MIHLSTTYFLAVNISHKPSFDFQDFPFLYQITYDAINLRQTAHVIFHLSCYNLDLAKAIVSMLLSAAQKLPVEQCQPFLKLITFLIDVAENGIPGLPSFMGIILPKLWKVFIFVYYCKNENNRLHPISAQGKLQ